MQLSRTKFRKSFIFSTKKWIKCFPGKKIPKNPVNSRGKSGDFTCIPGFYRANLDIVCRPCTNCTRPLIVEAVPCTTRTDRVCVPPLLVELAVNGLAVLNASRAPGTIVDQSSLDQRVGAETPVSPRRVPFRVFRPGRPVRPVPYLPGPRAKPVHHRLGPGLQREPLSLEVELSPCTQTADRICNRTLVINLKILGANGIDLGLLDLGRLALCLVYTAAQVAPSPGIVATPTPCPKGEYIDTVLLLCRPCSDCSARSYQIQPCSQANDAVCANCSACRRHRIAPVHRLLRSGLRLQRPRARRCVRLHPAQHDRPRRRAPLGAARAPQADGRPGLPHWNH